MGSNRKTYHLFYRVSIVAAATVGVAVYFAFPPAEGAWRGALALALLAILSELVPVSIGVGTGGEVAISAPIHWAAMVLFGPSLAMFTAAIPLPVVSALGMICAIHLRRHPTETHPKPKLFGLVRAIAGPWESRANFAPLWAVQIIIANTGLDVICVAVAAIAYKAAGGTVATLAFFNHASAAEFILRFLMPFCVGVLAYFCADEARFVTAVVLQQENTKGRRDWYSVVLSWKILLISSVRVVGGQYALLPPVTFLVIYLYVHVGILAGLVALGPFLALRIAFQKAVERQQLYMDTISTLATYMQHYHPYTRGHLKRVADMSERLARELRLPADTIMLMGYAGLLHDIGKVGVSEEILDKVGKLSDEEWSKIKEHPVKGAEIISHLDFLNRTVDWIKYHHKWANGSGYPDDGAKNGGIPIEAAIIAVADAFDAMTDDREMSTDWECDSCGYKPEDGERPQVCPSCGATKNRVYRQPLSVDAAIDELRRGAGSQFSPEVVKGFLQMVDREGIRVGGSS